MILNANNRQQVTAYMTYEEFKIIHKMLVAVDLGWAIQSIAPSNEELHTFRQMKARFDYLNNIFNEKKLML